MKQRVSGILSKIVILKIACGEWKRGRTLKVGRTRTYHAVERRSGSGGAIKVTILFYDETGTDELTNRVAELEDRARRFVLATTGPEGWENHFQALLMDERDYFNGLLTEVIAQLQRGIIAEVKCMLDQALATRIRGTYQSGTSYSRGDLVVRDGGSFLARHDDPGDCPGSGWQLIARQGSRGVRGERGERGRDAPVIRGWELDRSRYTAAPIMSDGTKGPVLELRPLFEQFQSETT
jgi:hypothetical protein